MDDNWTAMVRNLRRARKKWEQLSRLLGREVVDAWNSGRIYVAVVRAVLMYRSETWVITPRIGGVLGGFHHKVDLRLTVR